MVVLPRRWRPLLAVTTVFVLCAWLLLGQHGPAGLGVVERYRKTAPEPEAHVPLPPLREGQTASTQQLRLTKLADRYPVQALRQLPVVGEEGSEQVPTELQNATAPAETEEERAERMARWQAVRETFDRSWEAYKTHAWLADELQPVTGQARQDYNKLGGWAATLVDSLDALWLLDRKDEFRMAVKAVCNHVDFSHTEADVINVFETTIRYVGGLLGAYEISGGIYPELLTKATEIGEILLGAFDTPNRLPYARWQWRDYVSGQSLQRQAPEHMLAAELGSLSLEFTKLSQLTGDLRFYDAVQRISDVLAAHQHRTQLPGMWPVAVDAATPAFDKDVEFSLGGRADSLFEYLPKQWLLLGGALSQPRQMYEKFLPVAKKYLFRRVLNEHNQHLVLPGDAFVVRDDPLVGRRVDHSPRGQHLGCFVGGMVGLAAKAFSPKDQKKDLELAAELTDACVWVYNLTATGIGPEKFWWQSCAHVSENADTLTCVYSEDRWHEALRKHHNIEKSDDNDPLQQILDDGHVFPGILDMDDRGYQLRPEAVESIFVMWRLTGDRQWQDKAWTLFEHIREHTGAAPGARADTGQVAAAGIDDVTRTNSPASDHMETFWLAETLKYFALVFADWDVVSLNEWVLNTEGHPFLRADVIEARKNKGKKKKDKKKDKKEGQ